MNGKLVERKSFFLSWRPNRSLSRTGRLLWLGLIGSATFLPAAGAAILGAWMVLPFAGVEALMVCLAFGIIGCHDDDYEMLRISDQDFCWERNDRGRIYSLSGNRAWVQVVGQPAGGKFELCLRYAGKSVTIANLMSDEQRRSLSRELVRVLGHR